MTDITDREVAERLQERSDAHGEYLAEQERRHDRMANEGPTCPDCGAPVTQEKNWLTDDEYTIEIECTDCSFSIETESNLAAETKRR